MWDTDGSFNVKCNHEMVEVLPLDLQEDLDYVQQLLEEFVQYTGCVLNISLN